MWNVQVVFPLVSSTSHEVLAKANKLRNMNLVKKKAILLID